MQVIVPCSCGARFAFELDRFLPQLPDGAELPCPACGSNGIPAANRVLSDMANAEARSDTTVSRAAVPAQIPPPGLLSESEEEQAGPRLSMRARGVVGALAAAGVATACWYFLTLATGFESGYMAWGVGALVGLGCRRAAGERDYHLGLFAGACSFIAILLAQWLVMHQVFRVSINLAGEMAFAAEKGLAEKVAQIKTDIQIQEFLWDQKRKAMELDPLSAARSLKVSEKEVTTFKREHLPRLQRLSRGELQKPEFIAEFKTKVENKIGVKEIFNASLNVYTILWLVLGVGSAWRLASESGTSADAGAF